MRKMVNLAFVAIVFFAISFFFLQSRAGLTSIDLGLTDQSLSRYEYIPSYVPPVEYVNVDGIRRSYYTFVPDSVQTRLPLIVALHGAGRDGVSMVDTWYEVAQANGVAVIGLDSKGRRWDVNDDQQAFIELAIKDFLTKNQLEAENIYLFGHSSGAKQAIAQAVRHPDFYERVAVHAGTLPIKDRKQFLADVKTEVAIFLGDSDRIFSVPSARVTINWLDALGIPAKLYVLKNHSHWYYEDATVINMRIWQFLSEGK